MSRSADRVSAPRGRPLAVAGVVLVLAGVTATVVVSRHDVPPPERARTASYVGGQVGHVFVVNIENKRFAAAWGAHSAAPYLARTMRSQGVLLTHYFATAHHSLPNYVAQVSGQGPDPATQRDCGRYTAFRATGSPVPPGQAVGSGCVYPRSVRTLPGELTHAGISWKGYMEDMGRPCQHPSLGAADPWTKATATEQYASRHDPFVYFRAITDKAAYCRAHVVPLARLATDLDHVSTTPALSYITPDLCHDGHDATCANGGPGGMRGVNAWLRTWWPRIKRSPAFQRDGMLVITADESDDSSTACCGEKPGPNVTRNGIDGPGGGRVGALVISPFTRPGTTSTASYNHYSLLASLEDVFGVPRLGYARTTPRPFRADVFSAP